MQLHPIPALNDNYIWVLHDQYGHALAVDPGAADPVDSFMAERGLQLESILLTHHHADHIGAASELAARHQAHVVAPHDPRIESADQRVAEGDAVQGPGPWQFHVLAVPGHTRSHVAYFGEGIAFTGDTLFSLGCGRLFEGRPEEMLDSLERLAALPDDTLVCCGHEYTLANAAFARTIEPDNPALQSRIRQARHLRDSGRATLPSTIQDEKEANPFLRVDSSEVRRWAASLGIADDRIARFAALRQAKDRFRP